MPEPENFISVQQVLTRLQREVPYFRDRFPAHLPLASVAKKFLRDDGLRAEQYDLVPADNLHGWYLVRKP